MVRFVGYDKESRTLRVQFDKHVYEYMIVPEDVGREAEVRIAGGDHGWARKSLMGVYPYRKLV